MSRAGPSKESRRLFHGLSKVGVGALDVLEFGYPSSLVVQIPAYRGYGLLPIGSLMSTAGSRCLSLAGSLGKRSSTSLDFDSDSPRLFLGRELLTDALLEDLLPNMFLKRFPDSIAMIVEDTIKSGGASSLKVYAFNYLCFSFGSVEFQLHDQLES